jgi:RNA polymerase sigma-70 factor (ECF subfamily)
MQDFEIYPGIKDGEKEAFNYLFETYYKSLCRYTFSIIHDHDAAEDLIQDLFAVIWVNRKKLAIRSSFRSYLYQSAYHASLDYLKHAKIKTAFQSNYSEQTITFDDSIVIGEMQDKLEKSIERLPDQCKRIFKLSRFENLKYKEIASQLNISEDTVDTQIRRALNKLKSDLKDYLISIFIIFHLFF